MKYTIALLFTAALIAGCGSTDNGKAEVATANKLVAAQQYSEAIAYMQQAISKAPNNKEYKEELARLKALYLDTQEQFINSLLEQNISVNTLNRAENVLTELKKTFPSDSRVSSLESRFSELSSSFYSQLSTDYEQAKSFTQQQDLLSAHTLLKSIDSRFPNYEDVSIRTKSIESAALKNYIKEANDAAKINDFASARQSLEALLQILPNNPIALQQVKRIELLDSSDNFLSKAQKASSVGDYRGVIENCRVYYTYPDSTPRVCQSIDEQAKKNYTAELIEQIDQSLASGYLFKVGRLYDDLLSLNTLSFDEASAIRDNSAQAIFAKADKYAQNGDYAISLHLFRLVNSINPSYPELSLRIRNMEDQVNKRTRKSIAVFDFISPTSGDNSGVIVANNLISNLFNNASSDIRVIERDSLKSIQDQMKISQTSSLTESAAQEMNREFGIDYAIIGSVLIYKVDENTTTSTKTIRYQTGEKIQDNIDYLNWKAVNPNPTKLELQSAPKAKILVPEYDEREYEVTQIKKVGFIEISFRIVDILTGENTRVDTIERKLQVEDSANSGIADAGIPFDELEIATDTEILQAITDELVQDMSLEILKPLQNLETYYFNQGTDKERRDEVEEAVSYYTYAIFSERLKSVSNSPVSKAAFEKIDELLSDYQFQVM